MLQLLGTARRCCDGLTRRETLQAGSLAAVGGFGLPQYLQAEEAGLLRNGPAKNVIVLYLLGGAATQDMVDLKPHAPAEVRGEFKPISTNVPGIQICEHLPRMAQWAHRLAIVRSVNHKAGCHNCLPGFSGFDVQQPDQHPRDSDPPSMGSICEWLRQGRGDAPDYVFMPCWLGWGQSFRRAGPYGGYLGRNYDALTTEVLPTAPTGTRPQPGTPATVLGAPQLPHTEFSEGMTLDRLSRRRSLLTQFDDLRHRQDVVRAAGSYDRYQSQAFDILTSSPIRTAFDLSEEDPRMVERYGNTLFGNSTLIARRLVERGVRFVHVTWDLFWGPVNIDYDAWDTHTNNFAILKDNKLPGFDQTFSALLGDLEERGMLDETLIFVTSEMGRTPKINANAGRDHWTFCYSSMLAGAGIRGGTVYGSSDSHAAYPAENPVRPADLCMTVLDRLGISPELRIPDRAGRPMDISFGGRPIPEILTG
ncbi:MAG: DUF1501 domain-containing protein [Planctomycetaceae bacterium]